MCGIAGWLGRLDSREVVAREMCAALAHRGPDDATTRLFPLAGLVHTRLSVLDTSPAGNQPMTNEDGSVYAVVNGEIYNHHDLRRRLEARGHRFVGRSDAEVVPHLYEEDGLAFVERLRGMFAIAILDLRESSLCLARDRFGIKPLFFAHDRANDRVSFASELAALLHMPGINKRPNRQAVSDLAALSYIPAPLTFYEGITSVGPGQLVRARLSSAAVDIQRFHQWSTEVDQSLTPALASDRAERLIEQAVDRQIESDVPLGALLSGGIDSSLVSSAAVKASGGGLRSFSVRMPDPTYDETWAAVAVAQHIGSEHHVLELPAASGTWEEVCSLLLDCGQPYADTSIFAADALSCAVQRHVTVALAGDGGDEGFGGYSLFPQLSRLARLALVPPAGWRVAAQAFGLLARTRAVSTTIAARLRDVPATDDVGLLESIMSWVRPAEHRRLCHPVDVLPPRRLFERHWRNSLPTGARRIDRLSAHATEVLTRLVLPNDYLFKVDLASMRHSLEVRVPMLDEDLFGFGLTLPHAAKWSNGETKAVLRSVARRRLPSPVADKPKWGFAVPIDRWLTEGCRAAIEETLLDRSSPLDEFFDRDVFSPMVTAFRNSHAIPEVSRAGLYQRVMMLLAVDLHTRAAASPRRCD